jgi:hypothetical protein
MTNTTAEYWDVDGVSLNSYAQNLESWGGTREAPAPLRGGNQVVPFLPGEVWTPKVPGARSITLEGWIAADTDALLRVAWRAFRSLLWRPDELFTLTRRWYDDLGVLQTASALVEYESGLEPKIVDGGKTARFSVTLRLPEAFFFGPEITVPLVAGDNTFSPIGDYPSTKMSVVLSDVQTSVAIDAYVDSAIDNTLTYTSVAAGATATIDIGNFRATELLSGSTTKTSNKVGHSGRAQWFYLPKKMTRIKLARASGTGTATLKYQPAWH